MSPDTVSPGYVLAGRYQLTRLIGVGSSTATYEASDLTLQRSVAVKILLPQYADNFSLRERFQRVSAAVSGLTHPHLTRVYDSGSDQGVVFLVTEYLSGGSLRDVLDARRTLSPAQASRVGYEAALGLAAAHAAGFVHGSLHPSKIVFDADGRIRVIDFGLAGVLEPARVAELPLDTLRYIAPERVDGSAPDALGDVYSLCCILFESLTGYVAHDGTTADEITSRRHNSPLPSDPALGPLDLVVATGAAYDPRARMDAQLLAARLQSVGDSLPAPQTLATNSAFKAPSAYEVLGAPVVAPATRIPSTAPRPMEVHAGTSESAAERWIEPEVHFDDDYVPPPVMRKRRSPRSRRALALLAFIVIVGGFGVWKSGVLTARHDVPRLLGLSVAQSAKVLSADNFTLVVGAKVTSTEKIGNIVSQTPTPGSSLPSGGTITVNLSNGVPTVTLPVGLIGQSCAAATQVLVSVGLNAQCPSSDAVFSSQPIDSVVSVTDGTMVNPSTAAPHTTLTLILSKGPSSATGGSTTTTTPLAKGQVRVPNLVGLTTAQVTSALYAAELYYSSDSPSAPWKVVLSQSPPAGTVVAKFSRLRLKVQR